MTKTIALVAAAGLLLLTSVVATAQTRPNTSDQPVMVGADDGELSNTGFALRGRAEITQGQTRLRANAIEGQSAGGDVTVVTASGEGYSVPPTAHSRGDRATYTVASATIVVTGDVILTQGQNVLTGGRLTYNVDTGQARMEGGPTASGNRIRGVFYPQGSSD